MFLNSVVLILQEILEAALLISVLLAFTRLRDVGHRWIVAAIIIGCLGAFLYALNMAQISEWFDYVGQEVTNAFIQLSIMLLLSIFAARHLGRPDHQPSQGHNREFILCMLFIVSLALTREVSEIFIYIGGAITDPSNVQPTLIGAGIGAGIGISAGVLIYYSLLGLPSKWIALTGLLLLSLVAGNMASQATLLLTQADWLPYSRILWDSSELLPENSVLGHLLYALIGYEATPSLYQGLGYVIGMLLILIGTKFTVWLNNAAPKS